MMKPEDDFSEKLLTACASARLHIFVNAGLLNHIATDCILERIPSTDPVWIIDVNFSGGTQHHGRLFRTCIGKGSPRETTSGYRQMYRILRNIKGRAGQMYLYVPHVFHSIANYLAFYAGPEKIFLLPDGLLNYYDARITGFRQHIRMLGKFLLAPMLGGRYRLFRGELICRELVHYAGCHVFSTLGLTTAVGTVELLNYSAPHFVPVAGRSLYLDQPTEALAERARHELANALYAALRNESEILYKPHPTQRSCSIANSTRLPITPVVSKLPVEKVIAELQPERVLGIFSSALITLKLLYPDLDVCSVGTRYFTARNPRLAQAREAMTRLGIRVL